jgi:hypothetical protein
MKTTQYDNPPIGCYFDSARGGTDIEFRVIELAIRYGWEDKDAAEFYEKDEDSLGGDEFEELTDYAMEAVDHLNSLETRSFLSWQWYEGDFGLYPDVDGAKEDCGFVSSKNQDYPDDDYRGEWLHINDHGNATLYVRDEADEDKEIWLTV